MNILYISNLSGTLWCGPNNSVPAQIYAQAKIDHVFWLNLNNLKRAEWTKNGLSCKNLQDIPDAELKNLPEPFSHPDIVVLEELYAIPFNKLIKEIQKRNIPYVIIPRSQMTFLAQKHKHIKKTIANILFFNRLIKKAAAIQYLSVAEKKNSEKQWSANSFIIPNGIDIPSIRKHFFSENCIRATFIGRLDIYQKGLDLLISAIADMKDCLQKYNFKLSIYGPDRKGSLKILKDNVCKSHIDSIISFHDPVFEKNKERIFLNTDVFIMTSRFEGLPMGLIEALSYGIPCLVTQGTNMADVISEADAGWVADNNKDSIKTALLQMCGSEKFKEKSENSYKLAQRYSWNEIAKKSHNEYEKIVKSKVY